MKKKSQNEPVVFVPLDAELNFSNVSGAPPKTEYEKRRKTFSRKEVRDLTKGKYGRNGKI